MSAHPTTKGAGVITWRAALRNAATDYCIPLAMLLLLGIAGCAAEWIGYAPRYVATFGYRHYSILFGLTIYAVIAAVIAGLFSRRTSAMRERVARLVLVPFFAWLLFNIFGAWKAAIPKFRADPMLLRLSLFIGGGQTLWSRLQPWLGHPQITYALEFCYVAWLLILFVVLLAIMASAHQYVRRRFIIAFTLCWVVLGVVLAHLVPSAGPIFYRELYGDPGPYAPMFAYLDGLGLRSMLAEKSMWATRHGLLGRDPYSGISAFPSLHVAIPVLYVLTARMAGRRWLTLLAGVFALIIFLATIHLGWHYAIDGIVSAIGTAVLWWIAGRIVGHNKVASIQTDGTTELAA